MEWNDELGVLSSVWHTVGTQYGVPGSLLWILSLGPHSSLMLALHLPSTSSGFSFISILVVASKTVTTPSKSWLSLHQSPKCLWGLRLTVTSVCKLSIWETKAKSQKDTFLFLKSVPEPKHTRTSSLPVNQLVICNFQWPVLSSDWKADPSRGKEVFINCEATEGWCCGRFS